MEEQEVDHLEVVATELKEELNQISSFGTKVIIWKPELKRCHTIEKEDKSWTI